MSEITFRTGNLTVHHIFSPVEGFDDIAPGYVKDYRTFLQSSKITKTMQEAYISALREFPTYPKSTTLDGTIEEQAYKLLDLYYSDTIQNILDVLAPQIIEKYGKDQLPVFIVAFLEGVLRDIEIIKGDGKNRLSYFNRDLDCSCASILKSYLPDDYALGDYLARYFLADRVTALHVFGGVQ